MKKSILVSSFISFSVLCGFAQEPCGTDAVHQHMMQADEQYRSQIENLEAQVNFMIEKREKSAAVVHMIPVVVHVIHLGEPVGTGTNISDAQIQGAIDGINNRWRNYIGNGVDMEVQFCLAPLDTAGNPSSGIVRVNGSGVPNYSTMGINANNPGCGGADETAIKNLSRWSVSDYYNIWVVYAICGGWSGWAYYPWGAPNDGASIRYSSMTGASTIPAHELGHGFFLYHTFEGDGGNSYCPQDSVCANNGDRVCDTQPHKQSDCGAANPCTGSGTWDNSRYNYMSYCSGLDRFSQGQKTRVQATLSVQPRASLLLNAICPGTSVPEYLTTDIISVYPNPVTSLLTIEGLAENSFVTITDLAGKILFHKTAREKFLIDLSELENGVYILHSSAGVKKIVKM
jgi:hypothetical protein